MPVYKYKAINERGRSIRGSMLADNELDLENRLKQIGLHVMDYTLTKQDKANALGRVRLKDMIIMCLHLEQLEKAGVPLLEAIADVRDTTESVRLKNIMTGVYESVKSGTVFSKALSDYPEVFNDVFVGLIAAGEKTGDLSQSLHHLSEHLKWLGDIQRKIIKAVSYPAFVFVLIILLVTLLMIFLVPKLLEFIVSQGFDVPLHTRVLMVVSGAFVDYWYILFGAPALAVGFVMLWYKSSDEFAYRVDGMLLNLPILGKTLTKINLARFTHFFSIMFKSGIDVLEALATAKRVVGNRVIAQSVDVVIRSVTEGNTLTESMRMSHQFPSLVVRMFKVGEDSGNMNEALENVNFFYNREVNDAVDTLTAMIYPALTIVMGTIIFWVISSIFGPLYQSLSKMNF